jgi:hypothetical protein
MVFIVKRITITRFFIACVACVMESVIFIVQSYLETVHDTVQYRYCIFFIAQLSLEDWAKTSESVTFIRTTLRECTLSMYDVVYSTLYYYFI